MNPDQVEFERQFLLYDLSKNPSGGYASPETMCMFIAWNAALMYERAMMVQTYAAIGVIGGGAVSSQSLGSGTNAIGQSIGNANMATSTTYHWNIPVNADGTVNGNVATVIKSTVIGEQSKPGINDQVQPELMRKRVSEW